MRRVAVVGNGGGGKSTLARRLAERHRLSWCSVDRVQWAPGWTPRPSEEVAAVLDEIASGDGWVIDGWGPWPSIERRLRRADTIVFVDLPLWMHFWLAAERQIAVARGEERPDPLEGCDDLAVTRRLFETIWVVDRDSRPRLAELVAAESGHATVHHLRTLEALEEMSRR